MGGVLVLNTVSPSFLKQMCKYIVITVITHNHEASLCTCACICRCTCRVCVGIWFICRCTFVCVYIMYVGVRIAVGFHDFAAVFNSSRLRLMYICSTSVSQVHLLKPPIDLAWPSASLHIFFGTMYIDRVSRGRWVREYR